MKPHLGGPELQDMIRDSDEDYSPEDVIFIQADGSAKIERPTGRETMLTGQEFALKQEMLIQRMEVNLQTDQKVERLRTDPAGKPRVQLKPTDATPPHHPTHPPSTDLGCSARCMYPYKHQACLSKVAQQNSTLQPLIKDMKDARSQKAGDRLWTEVLCSQQEITAPEQRVVTLERDLGAAHGQTTEREQVISWAMFSSGQKRDGLLHLAKHRTLCREGLWRHSCKQLELHSLMKESALLSAGGHQQSQKQSAEVVKTEQVQRNLCTTEI
eukprot:superscaffoldBa00000688_g6581